MLELRKQLRARNRQIQRDEKQAEILEVKAERALTLSLTPIPDLGPRPDVNPNPILNPILTLTPTPTLSPKPTPDQVKAERASASAAASTAESRAEVHRSTAEIHREMHRDRKATPPSAQELEISEIARRANPDPNP